MLLILFADNYLRMVLRPVNDYMNMVVDGNSMTPKQRMMKIMSDEPVDVMPVEWFSGTELMCHHSGMNVLEFFYEADARAESKVRAHVDFQKRFCADAQCLWARGAPRHWRERYKYEVHGEHTFMVDTRTGQQWPMSDDNCTVLMDELPDPGPFHFERGEVEVAVNGKQYFAISDKFDIRCKADVDRLFPLEPADSVIERGMFEVIRTMAKKCGDEQYIEAGGIGGIFRFAMGITGFPDGYIFMREKPAVLKHLLERLTKQNIEYAKAYKVLGADGVHTADFWTDGNLISQEDWMEFVFPYTQEFIRRTRQIGLKVKYYFVGNVRPRLQSLRELEFDSLQLEQTCGVDFQEVRKILGPEVCLHTNLDARYLMKHGTPAEIEAELANQVQAAGGSSRLICSIGGEISPDTPPENLDALITAAHSYPG